jgi:Protein of unknown function (DUF3592)
MDSTVDQKPGAPGKPAPDAKAAATAARHAAIGRGFFLLFALIFFLLGGDFLLTGVRHLVFSLQSPRWPMVGGRVVGSEVKQDGKTFHPDIRYEYSVKGFPYVGDDRNFGEFDGPDRAVAQKVADRYPAGGEVQVYYRFADPQVAVLEPGFRWGQLAEFIPAVMFLGGAAIMIYLLPHMKEGAVQQSEGLSVGLEVDGVDF